MQTILAWDRNGTDPQTLTWDQLSSYGSAKLGYYTTSSKTSMSHFIAAETIAEKSSYIPTDDATVVNTALWNPELLLGIKGPAALGDQQAYALTYAIEWTFDCTFRGTRYM